MKKIALEDKSLSWQKNDIFKFTQTRAKIGAKRVKIFVCNAFNLYLQLLLFRGITSEDSQME